MFLGRFYILLCLLLLSFPSQGWAQVSQTVTFTLSVTVPQRAEIPAAPTSEASPSSISQYEHRFFLQPDIRENQLVYLASYVVD